MSKSKKRSLRYRLDKLAVYAPMLVMALLAMASYWLLYSVNTSKPAATAPLHPDQPDYTIRDFSVRTYLPDGNLSAELFGTYAQHYPINDMLDVDRPRMRIITEDGRVIIAQANTGSSNGDASQLHLEGNAVVVQLPTDQTPRMEFHGNDLWVWPEKDLVKSNQPVQLTRGTEKMSGDNLLYNKKQQTTQIDGRVHTIIPATPAPAEGDTPDQSAETTGQ